MKKFLTLAIACLMAVGLTACGKQVNPNAGPKWVNSRSTLEKDFGKGFYSVGTFQGSQNQGQIRLKAEERARQAMGALLSTYVTSLSKDYMASTTAGDMSAVDDEQHVETAMKLFVQQQVQMAAPIEYHYERGTNAANGTIYCLMKLDYAKVTEELAKVKNLSEKLRDFVRKNADKAFDGLDQEAAKHAN